MYYVKKNTEGKKVLIDFFFQSYNLTFSASYLINYFSQSVSLTPSPPPTDAAIWIQKTFKSASN